MTKELQMGPLQWTPAIRFSMAMTDAEVRKTGKRSLRKLRDYMAQMRDPEVGEDGGEGWSVKVNRMPSEGWKMVILTKGKK
jgi:hypothetical protein